MLFTLCIPTMDRYDKYLSVNLVKYVENPLISEIIITDENGNDIDKILQSNIDKTKLKLYKNKEVLGPFLNKVNACKLSTNEWIALIDSDNFADENYFKHSQEYIATLISPKYDIISPSIAKPAYDFTYLSNNIISKNNLNSIVEIERQEYEKNESQLNGATLCLLMNFGNYILNKSLVTHINLDNEMKNMRYSSACDVIYFNTLLFEQLDLKFHVLAGLEYEHASDDSSIYKATYHRYPLFNNMIHNRFFNLCSV